MELFLNLLYSKNLICKLSLQLGVQLLAMACTDHQGAAWNIAGIGDVVLAAGSSGGTAGPNGPWREQNGGAGEQALPGQGGCEQGPITPKTATSGGSGGWGRRLAPTRWGSWVGTRWLRWRGAHGAPRPQVLPRAQRSAGTCPSSPDACALITGQA